MINTPAVMSFTSMSRIINIVEDIVKGLPKVAAVAVVARGEKTPPPTIPNCKILGFKSRNNRVYAQEAVQAAAHKYEGVKVNLDHNTGTDPRKFSERFGRMVNVRFQPGQGLFGDLQYNPKHPLAEAFCWWIKNDPTAIGLSHNATAEVKNTAEGGEIVTEIRDVDSVDLVADPATTKGLFESYGMRQIAEDHPTAGETEGYRAYYAGIKQNPYKRVSDKSNQRPRIGDTTNQINWQNGWEKARHEMTSKPPYRTNQHYYGRTNEADDESQQMENVLLGNEPEERNAMNPEDDMPEMAPPPPINTDMDQAPVEEAIDDDGDFASHLGNAILAIINDAGLSSADKRKKVLGALKLMDDGEEVPEADEEAMPPETGDMPAEPIDEEMEPVEEGADGDDETAAMEAALLGDEPDGDEMPMKKPAQESVQIAKLKAQLDAYRVQESLRKKKASLLKACKEAKIPTEAVTPIFVSQLMKLKESTWPKLIADRKKVAKVSIQKPVSTSVVATDSYTQFVTELLNN